MAFLANPITSTINAVRIVRNPDGTITAEHLPDFLKSEDGWFRPVNIEFGPDGCLYIADTLPIGITKSFPTTKFRPLTPTALNPMVVFGGGYEINFALYLAENCRAVCFRSGAGEIRDR